jgi:hypothetical protein
MEENGKKNLLKTSMTPKIEPSTKVLTSLAQSRHLNNVLPNEKHINFIFYRNNVMHQSSNSKNTRSMSKQKHSFKTLNSIAPTPYVP